MTVYEMNGYFQSSKRVSVDLNVGDNHVEVEFPEFRKVDTVVNVKVVSVNPKCDIGKIINVDSDGNIVVFDIVGTPIECNAELEVIAIGF